MNIPLQIDLLCIRSHCGQRFRSESPRLVHGIALGATLDGIKLIPLPNYDFSGYSGVVLCLVILCVVTDDATNEVFIGNKQINASPSKINCILASSHIPRVEGPFSWRTYFSSSKCGSYCQSMTVRWFGHSCCRDKNVGDLLDLVHCRLSRKCKRHWSMIAVGTVL